MGRWLDLGLSEEKTLDHMESLGIRRLQAEFFLDIERGIVTGDIKEKRRPKEALGRLFKIEEVSA